jgi:hypothetical protein
MSRNTTREKVEAAPRPGELSSLLFRPGIPILWSDADLAVVLRVSRSWIRKQRMLRRAGRPHSLKVDPVLIGSGTCPRYVASEIDAWIQAQRQAR